MIERVIDRGGKRTRITLTEAGVVVTATTTPIPPAERAFPEPLDDDLRGLGLRVGGVA